MKGIWNKIDKKDKSKLSEANAIIWVINNHIVLKKEKELTKFQCQRLKRAAKLLEDLCCEG